MPSALTATTFEHAALLYDGPRDLVARTAPFVRAGLDAGEPVMVAAIAPKLDALAGALGSRAGDVRFADMAELGANPARIIPAWRAFLDAEARPGRGARGVGEPIWAGRTEPELTECQLHERLLGEAFADAAGFRLTCPYDTAMLDPAVVHEACCCHPLLHEESGLVPNPRHRPAPVRLDAPLPPPAGPTRHLAFGRDDLPELRALVAAAASEAGLPAARGRDLRLAVHELAVNSIEHGGGLGVLRAWPEDDRVVAEVRDRGRLDDPLAGRRAPRPEQVSGRGLWIANAVCDLVQIRSGADGTIVRAHLRRR